MHMRAMHCPVQGERVESDGCLWRQWVWTAEGRGVPSGPLYSDSRFADAEFRPGPPGAVKRPSHFLS
jgi:hypothetical protein